MTLYISGLSILFLLAIYLPVVLVLLFFLARSRRFSRRHKYWVIPVFLVLAAAIPLWDVVMNSLAMAKVCPRAGLHVYRTVQVEGYYDPGGSGYNVEQGLYRYIELGTNKLQRIERQADGSTKQSRIVTPSAEYEVVYEDFASVSGLGVRRMQRRYVRHRVSGEVLGEWVSFAPLHGWLDRYFLNQLFGGSLPGCDGRGPGIRADWRQAILLPLQSSPERK